jgi:hypothetical protein
MENTTVEDLDIIDKQTVNEFRKRKAELIEEAMRYALEEYFRENVLTEAEENLSLKKQVSDRKTLLNSFIEGLEAYGLNISKNGV